MVNRNSPNQGLTQQQVRALNRFSRNGLLQRMVMDAMLTQQQQLQQLAAQNQEQARTVMQQQQIVRAISQSPQLLAALNNNNNNQQRFGSNPNDPAPAMEFTNRASSFNRGSNFAGSSSNGGGSNQSPSFPCCQQNQATPSPISGPTPSPARTAQVIGFVLTPSGLPRGPAIPQLAQLGGRGPPQLPLGPLSLPSLLG